MNGQVYNAIMMELNHRAFYCMTRYFGPEEGVIVALWFSDYGVLTIAPFLGLKLQ